MENEKNLEEVQEEIASEQEPVSAEKTGSAEETVPAVEPASTEETAPAEEAAPAEETKPEEKKATPGKLAIVIGAIVVGVGLPSLSNEREAMKTYFEEKYEAGTAYAYTYPGMNRVLQAAGRVIRSEEDRGVVVLIDNRFAEPVYRELMPSFWHGLKYAGDLPALTRRLTQFWHPKDNT